MADKYTGSSDQVREQATEELFNRDTAPKHSKKDEAEELGAGLQSRNSEELFLQSILEGSRDGTISYSGDESDASAAATAAGVGDTGIPTLEKEAYQEESGRIPGLVADITTNSVERDESASDQSGFEVESGDPGKAGISSDSSFGKNLESGVNQAGHSQQSQPVEPQMASLTQVGSGSQSSNAEVVDDSPALKKTQSESEINHSPDDISISAAEIVEGTEGGILVATVTGSDQNAGEVLSYSIESDPSGIFELVGNQLFLKENVNIDYEVSQTHSVALQVTDEIGNSFTKVFYIEVEDINETPVLDVVSSVTVAEDGSTVISFTATDVDLGDSEHTAASADHGTVAVDADSGEITYTPTSNFNGSDTITVTTTDNDGAQVVKTVSVTVNDINDAPTLSVVSTASVDEDGSKTISFTAADVDGTVSTAAAADHGMVAVDENSGEITYTPTANFNGSDTVTVTTTDNDGAQVVKTVSVTVNDINDAPTLSVVSTASVDEDGSKTISFTAGDVDGSVSTASSADNGAVTVDENSGEISYTPNANFNGSDTITVTTTDNDGAQVVKTVSVTVNDVNDAPTLNVLSTATVDEDGSKTISFTAGDLDGTVSTAASADNGTVTVDAESGEITYTPNEGFHGDDTLTLTATDDDGAAIVKTVSVTVTESNIAPTASDDVGFTPQNATLAGEMTFDNGVSTASMGSVVASDSGQVDNAAVMNSAHVEMNGLDLSSQSGEQTTVSMWVKADPSGSWEMIAASDRYDLAFKDGDLGFNTARGDLYGTDASEFNDGEWHQVVATFTNGDVTQNSIYIDGVQQDLSQIRGTPSSASANIASDGGTLHFGGWGANSSYRFTGSMDEVKVFNGALGEDEIADLYSIESQSENWNQGLIEGEENKVLEINPSTLLANDTDADGDTLSITSVESATHGTVEMVDGKIVFTPEEDYEGTASFDYTVSDGEGGTDTATVEISLAANTDPVLVSDGSLVLQNATLAGEMTFDEGLPSSTNGSVSLENDGQVEGAADLSNASIQMSDTDVSSEAGAQTTISMWVKAEPSGSWEMIAASDYYDLAFNNGDLGFNTARGDLYGTDASEFNDGEWHQVVATFTNGDVTQNSIYIDGVQQDLSQIRGTPSSANANIASDGGTLHFGGWGGNSSYRFTGSMDEIKVYHGDLSAAEVGRLYEIESQGQTWNEATNLTTDEDSAITIDVLANDTDVDGDTLTITDVGVVTDADGKVVGEAEIVDNKIQFTPNGQLDALEQGEQGMVSFTYTASDGRGGFSSTTVQIDVNGTNDAPTLEVVSAATVNEDGSKTISFTAGDLDGTVSTAASANNGTAIVDENSGEITYTPDANFNGSDTIIVTTTDNNGASAVKTVSVTVNEVNDAPIDISFSGNSVTENA
ncbi:MAG: tandem-95 repeat protein, partial [Gammaproteobacteria bacterium]|nr:tandem-95 repeat protein [Gammaproteobacteria bacterium]